MPLREGKTKSTIGFNIGEMLRSATFGAGKGKAKRQSMASAAAYGKAREGGASLPKKKKKKKEKPFASIQSTIQAKRKRNKQLEDIR